MLATLNLTVSPPLSALRSSLFHGPMLDCSSTLIVTLAIECFLTLGLSVHRFLQI